MSLDHLILVSESFQASEKKNEQKPIIARIDKNHQVSFGRTMQPDRVNSTGKLQLIKNGKLLSPINENQRPKTMNFARNDSEDNLL